MSVLRALDPLIAAVFITDELHSRVPKKADHLQEMRAFQELAARMIDDPGDVLPRFVDLAMEITGGVAAGLSLYEKNPAPGLFRWQYLRGSLAPFDGATTPRNFSPCGITLDRNAPVLTSHPERVYSWIADANIIAPEVLLVPLYLGGNIPLGTLWIVSDEEEHFDSGHSRALTELARFVGIALRMLQSEQHLRHMAEEQETIAREMSHRLKNVFAMVEGMIRMGDRNTSTKHEFAEALSGRVHALGIAHALVRRNFSEIGLVPLFSDLDDLIRTIIKPHESATTSGEPRFSTEGPSVTCADHAVNGIALVFHELATNGAKYGALKSDSGHVRITWHQDKTDLLLRWEEHGGPAIKAPPATKGFGSTLVSNTIVRQFGGAVNYDWQPQGLIATISLPIDRLSS